MSVSRWMDKEEVVHICNGILFSNKKEKILLFATTWMELEDIKLSEEARRRKISAK